MSTSLHSDADSKALTPEVTWAQRSSKTEASKNFIYLTISAPDVDNKGMKLDLQSASLTFSGYSESKKATYAVKLEFYADIDPSQSITHHSARDVELKLQKKELNEEYWPRLLKDSKKMHFLKTNFDKWVDEDEQDGEKEDDYMNQFGAGGGGGMPGMGGDGSFGSLDFSKLGGGGGAAGLDGDDGEMDEEDDDEMPDLGDETGVDKHEMSDSVEELPEATGATGASATKTAASSSKITEIE